MEFGIGMFGDLTFDETTQKFQSVSQKYGEIIEQVKLADELGIDVFAIGEHHRADYSVSSPEILLAALSTVTKRIKLASGVTVLSSSDPVKVYQDFASVDLLSNGRAEIIAGRGSFIESYPLFGYDLKDYESLFEEKLDLLLQINTHEKLTWSGKHRAPLNNQTVHPRAEQTLPIWIAVGGTPESVHRAARLGLPLIVAIIGGQPKQFKPFFDYYKDLYVKYGHDVNNMQVGVHSHAFLTTSKEELVDGYFPYYAAQMDRVGRSRGWSSYTKHQFISGLNHDGALYMGEPNLVAEKMIQSIEMFGLTRYVAHMDVGGPSHAQMMKSIELYATKVIPQVKNALS
jgi:probable LLM family oxidoreductase